MASKYGAKVSKSARGDEERPPRPRRIILPRVDVLREGRVEPFLSNRPTLSSAPAQWGSITLQNYTVPAVLIPRHEHPNHFLHLVLRGTVKYEVNTRGRNLRFTSRPGTIFLLPRGTVDEVNWAGPTNRMALPIHPPLPPNSSDATP